MSGITAHPHQQTARQHAVESAMNPHGLGPIVKWTIWAVLMALIMGWVARSRRETRPSPDCRRLVHPASTLVIGLAGFLLFAGIAVISNVFSNKTTTWWTTTAFVIFALLSLLVAADYFLARHDLSEEGLRYGRLTGSRGNLKWSELRRVNYAPTMKWFRLETRSGDVARVSVMHIGLPEFAGLLLAHAPPGVIDPETLGILQETAAGRLPPV
jgi:hypothetical protein